MVTSTNQFSQSELVEQIWTNRDTKTFSLKKKDLQAMDIDALLAVAEENNLTVLHYDSDVDIIAEVAGQSCHWIVPAGTID